MDFIFANEPQYLRRQLAAHKFFNAVLLFLLAIACLVAWDLAGQRDSYAKVANDSGTLASFWEVQTQEQKATADRLLRNCSGRDK